MASVHHIGNISYTADQEAQDANGDKIIFNVENIELTSASAADAVKSLGELTSPLIVATDEAVASGLALIYIATKSRLSSEEAIRLGAVLQLPALASPEIAAWVHSAITDITAGHTESFIFRQLFDPTSSTFTYLLADADTKEAVLIDPVLEQVDRDLDVIKGLGLNLILAINTHCHADHITGTGLLKQRLANLKSGIAAAAGAKADILFVENDIIKFGKHTLIVIPTPGHTDGCVSYYTDSGGGAIFTGDALLIRGCGRTDFQQGSAVKLYQSVHHEIFSLPPHTLVYPAHDYRNRSKSSVVEEKLLNPRLTKPKEEFVKIMAELNLAYPKKIDIAVPANLQCGVHELAAVN